MKTALIIIVIVQVFSASFGAKFPSEWKSCKENKDFSECLKVAIEDALVKMKDGVAALGIPPLDPINLPSATIGEGKGAVNVVQNYKNFQIFGISTLKIPKMDAKYTPSSGLNMELDAYFTEAKLIADYDFNGRVLLLPIVGKGKCQIVISDVTAPIKFTSEITEKDGVKYIKVTSIKVKLNPGKVTFNFENLFNGDARLGDELNKVLNDNWKEVFIDVEEGYSKVLEAVFYDYAVKVFSKIPAEEIF